MKITIRKFKLLLFVLTLNSIPCLHADVSTPPNLAYTADQEQEIVELFVTNILKQLDELDIILEELQAITENNGLAATSKRELLDAVKENRLIIQRLRDNSTMVADTSSLQTLNTIVEGLIQHVHAGVKNSFKEFTGFNIESVIVRGLGRLASFESIEEDLMKNSNDLEQLKTSISTVGLTWYNRVYRAFDARVIQPGQKYRILSPDFPWIGSVSKIGVFVGGLAAWTALHTANDASLQELEQGLGKDFHDKLSQAQKTWLDNPTETNKSNLDNLLAQQKKFFDTSTLYGRLQLNLLWVLRKVFGYAPQGKAGTNTLDQDYHKDRPIGIIGRFEWVARQGGYTGGFLMGSAATAISAEWKKICETMDKKATGLVKTLKGGAYKDHAKQQLRVVPKVKLDDLVGLDEVKEVFSKLVMYFKDPERFDRSKLDPERGFLLTGPTRTGKTFSAEALAGEIRAMYKQEGRNEDEFNFFPIPAAVINQYGISNILKEAQEYAPCILFIDEIDLLGLQRVGGNPEKLSEFLNAMSGALQVNPSKPVILMAATNRPENLDKALCQKGRFGTEIRFEYPTYHNRKDFLISKLNNLTADASKFDIDRLAREAEDCSYEELKAILRSAFLDAKIQGKTLTQAYIDAAFDREIRKIMFRHNHSLSPEEERILAAHIAGMVLAMELLSKDEKIAKATLLPCQPRLQEEITWMTAQHTKETEQKKIEFGQVFSHHLQDTRNIRSYQKQVEIMKRLLAGFVAEEILLGTPSGYSYRKESMQQAYEIAKLLTTQGLDIDKFTNDIKTDYLRKAITLKQACEQDIKDLLTNYKPVLEALMNALIDNKTITGDDITQLIEQHQASSQAALIA